MRMHADLSLRHEQRLALLPKMLQSIEVLQLATQDLLRLIDTELEQNETLEAELKQEEPEALRESAPEPQGDDAERFDPRELRGDAGSGERDAKLDFLNGLAADAATLLDSIREQLTWWDLPAALRECVLAVAERLDERGLLTASDEELAVAVGSEHLADAIRVLQCLEPRGIGARDPIGALLLQIEPDDPDYADIEKLLTVHLEDLAKNRVPQIAKVLDRSIDEVQDLVDRVRGLDPHPGAAFRSDANTVIRPDAEARIVDGEIQVRVDDQDLPSLGVNEQYAAMAKDRAAARDLKDYLRGKIASAKSLIRAVEQRKRTLGRVTAAIMAHQRAFLERGRAALRPLAMASIATELGLHVSTVSRAIAGKHVLTQHGTIALRDFFDGGAPHGAASTGTNELGTGRLGVKEHVKDLIAAEDGARPLSDDDIVGLLAARGIKVARRTVAKYRTELGIKTSFLRRKYGA